jgi:hypothetical protein
VLLKIESEADLSAQQKIARKRMSLKDLTLDSLGLVFGFLDHGAQSAWCNSWRRVAFLKHQRLLRLKNVQLHPSDSVLDGNTVRDAFWVAANLTTRPSNLRCGSVSIAINPVNPMSGKIDLCIRTGLEIDFLECMGYIPDGIVEKITLYFYNGDSNSQFLDCDLLPEEVFLQQIGAFCTKMDLRELEMHYMGGAFHCNLESILCEFTLPRLERLCLTNFDATDAKDNVVGHWFADKPLQKLDLRQVHMDAAIWDKFQGLSTLTHFEVSDCNLNAEETLQMDFKTPLESFVMRGKIANFRDKSVAIAWAGFCKRNCGLKHLTITVGANFTENFDLYLEPLQLLNLEQLDMRFNLDRSHFAFFKISKTLVKMSKLLKVSLRQTDGAQKIAFHQKVEPSVKYPPLDVTPGQAATLVGWLQGLTKLELENLALHKETQSLILDTICTNQTLEMLYLNNISTARTLPAECTQDLRRFRHVNTCGAHVEFILPYRVTMSNLTELELVGGWNLQKSLNESTFLDPTCQNVQHLVVDFQGCSDSTTKFVALNRFLLGVFDFPHLKSLEIRNVDEHEFIHSLVRILNGVSHDEFSLKELRSFTFYLSYSSYETLKRLIVQFVKCMPNLQNLFIYNIMYERCVFDFIDMFKSCECLEHLHFSFHQYTYPSTCHHKFAFQETSYRQLKCITFDDTKIRPLRFHSYVKDFGKMFAKQFSNILVTDLVTRKVQAVF